MNTSSESLIDRVDSRHTSLSDFTDFAHPDLFHKAGMFAKFLEDGRQRGYETYVHRVQQYTGGSAILDGEDRLSKHRAVMMCSADYLGLARNPKVLAGAKQAIEEFGSSVCSVPLIAGATSLHQELEAALARFIGTEACVLFPTGQAANMGCIQALCGRKDTVILDRMVHCSIVDGVRLSGARWRTFRHSDPDHLSRVLKTEREKNPARGILVVIEGVYGINGDLALMGDMLALCDQYEARVLVDDAHATGVIGARGRGSPEQHDLSDGKHLIMGSLSKAFGSFGGWIATTNQVADYLRYYANTIAFSVGLPASCAGAALAALQMLIEETEHRERLKRNVDFFKAGLLELGVANAKVSGSAIFSIPVGSEQVLRDISRELFRNGVYAEALGFPAVPHKQERIRFRVSASHSIEELRHVLQVTAVALRQFAGCPSG